MKPLKREDRRVRTENIAKRRFKRLLNCFKLPQFLKENTNLPESIGLFKKDTGMSIKKESSRAWNKIDKEKKERIKELRRNGKIDIDDLN